MDLKDVDPLTMCVLFDKILNKLSENRQYIKKDMIETLLKLFRSLVNEVPLMNIDDF
jgi:hypothetical protein